jgi:hypothetical protein
LNQPTGFLKERNCRYAAEKEAQDEKAGKQSDFSKQSLIIFHSGASIEASWADFGRSK